jgi:hypothetical protein
MYFDHVQRQLQQVYERAIETGVSVKQNFPVIKQEAGYRIGDLKASTVALKDLPYKDIYTELDSNNQYHLKLPDGALLLFQYSFGQDKQLIKHRLGYFPSPDLPSPEEAPELYSRDDLYGDIVLKRIVRFPVRFDYDPSCYRPIYHAHSHLTLGQFDNCRIPASHPVAPNVFLKFILRNFYFLIYRRNQNVLEKKIAYCGGNECITAPERRLTFMSIEV